MSHTNSSGLFISSYKRYPNVNKKVLQPNQYSGSNINEKIIEACFLLFEKRVSNIALLPVKKLRDYMVTDASFEEEKFLTLIPG